MDSVPLPSVLLGSGPSLIPSGMRRAWSYGGTPCTEDVEGTAWGVDTPQERGFWGAAPRLGDGARCPGCGPRPARFAVELMAQPWTSQALLMGTLHRRWRFLGPI